MLPLTGKNMVVIDGSRGVGRRIVEAAIREGAGVLAVARQEAPLRQLVQEVPGVEVLSIDATDEGAPSKVFDVLQPEVHAPTVALAPIASAFSPASSFPAPSTAWGTGTKSVAAWSSPEYLRDAQRWRRTEQ